MTDETARQADAARRAVVAVWRIEAAKIVAVLTRFTGDFALAEDLAQASLAEALEQWPSRGVPRNAAAWLTQVGKRRAIDHWRREERYADRIAAIGVDLERTEQDAADAMPFDPDEIADDVLRLVFTACHPSLTQQARVALTLRVVAGLETAEIARAFLVPVSTIQQRIVRAKQTLSEAGVPFETPSHAERPTRLAAVTNVLYLIFTEGHTATEGEEWMRTDLAREALRLSRILAALQPDEPEVHSLLALLELAAARSPARVNSAGEPVLLADQDRRRWDRSAIERGRAALRRAEGFGRGLGVYGLQAAIAECHAIALSVETTNWRRIVAAYEDLESLGASPVVALNRAVAVSQAEGPGMGPEAALAIVDELAGEKALAVSHLLPSVQGRLLAMLGRDREAAEAFALAAERADNERERAVLLALASRE